MGSVNKKNTKFGDIFRDELFYKKFADNRE